MGRRRHQPASGQGSLAAALEGADVFIGLSVPGILTVRDLKRMARDPIVFAMANPEPEIRSGSGRKARSSHGDGALRLSEPDQ